MRVTCSKCLGNKTYRGMGSMIVKCEPCKGIGFVDAPKEDNEPLKAKPAKKVTKGKSDGKDQRDDKDKSKISDL